MSQQENTTPSATAAAEADDGEVDWRPPSTEPAEEEEDKPEEEKPELEPFFADDYSSSSSDDLCLGPTTLTLPKLGTNQFSGHEIAGPSKSAAAAAAPAPGDEFDNWDPKAKDYYSIQNLLGSDIGHNPGAFALGVKDKNRVWSEVPCPFYKGEGSFCWKGQSCRMLHVIDDPNNWGKERIATSYTLDDKPILNLGIMLEVAVQHVVSPAEFYVIPVTAPVCICESAFLPKEKTDPEPENLHKGRGNMDKIRIDSMLDEFGTGLKALDTLKSKLHDILEVNYKYRERQTPYYTKTQLVAVKFIDAKRVRTWFRAVIIDPNVTDAVDRQIPYHKITLIDIGETLTVCADDLCPLPISLSFYPALAFKCCLNGVVPVGPRWASRTTSTFENLTAGQTLLMTVSKAKDYDGVCKTVESQPYLVDLLMNMSAVPESLRPTYHRPTVSVAEILTENGMVIKLNNFPHRPALGDFVCHNNDLLLAPLNTKTLPLSTKHEESVRVFDVLAEYIKDLKTDLTSETRKRTKSF